MKESCWWEEEEEKATKFHTPRDMQGTSSLADLSGGGVESDAKKQLHSQ